jgi:hypothetical protein
LSHRAGVSVHGRGRNRNVFNLITKLLNGLSLFCLIKKQQKNQALVNKAIENFIMQAENQYPFTCMAAIFYRLKQMANI